MGVREGEEADGAKGGASARTVRRGHGAVRGTDKRDCQRCGREMVWRKSWAKTWDEVKYCSEKCKRTKGL